MEEKKIVIKNIETYYKVFGEGLPFGQGKTLLILHGWPSHSDRWTQAAEFLMQKNTRVVVPDLPGFGKSQVPIHAWNINDYVEWLEEFSKGVPELGSKFFLLGHSFGGALAAKFAIKYNQHIEKLFLISAACIRRKTWVKKLFYVAAKAVKIFSFLPGYPYLRKACYRFIIKKSDYPYQTGVMQEAYLKVISEDLSYKLSFIKVPTVIIWGDKDTLTPIDQAHIIHKKIPNSKLIIIPGADHLLNVKIPEALAQKIIENFPAPSYNDQLLSLKNII